MKIEVGKFYRARDGAKVNIEERFGVAGARYPLRSSSNAWYTESGRWGSDRHESPHDLIALWEEEEPKMKLQVGKSYKTRNGQTVNIVATREIEGGIKFLGAIGGENYSWDEDGTFSWSNPGHGSDLIALAKEEPPFNLLVGRSYRTLDGKTARIVKYEPGRNLYWGNLDDSATGVSHHWEADGTYTHFPRTHDYTIILSPADAAEAKVLPVPREEVTYTKRRENYPYGGWVATYKMKETA